MSYADDMGYYAWDGDEIMQEEKRLEQQFEKSLRTGIHIDKYNEEIDVRNVDKEHAKRIMYWYFKKYADNESKKEFLKTEMFRLLRKNINS